MERDERIARVKRDLRSLRKISYSIDVGLRVEEMYRLRASYLERNKQIDENTDEIVMIHNAVSSLRIKEMIREATALEALYMNAISKLDPLDRTIILEGYINGKTYRNIGRNIGYTESGVQKRVNRIIKTIATFV